MNGEAHRAIIEPPHREHRAPNRTISDDDILKCWISTPFSAIVLQSFL